jgi:phosphopantetheinyl transferase (holo-ACP synthase)
MTEPTPYPPTVGNDVVDLEDPRTADKVSHTRFLDRVLAPEERTRVLGADDPDGELWRCWAGKEAAYKVVSKVSKTPPVFVHRSYVTSPTEVVHGAARYPLDIEVRGRVLHAVACVGTTPADTVRGLTPLTELPEGGDLDSLMTRFTDREGEAVHSLASAAVRLSARSAAARALGVEERRLEIVCDPGPTGRRPPRLLLDGAPAPADVSLSHHGGWIGWALVLR